MKKLQLVSAMTFAFGALTLSNATNAAVVGASSNTSHVQIAASEVNGGPHTSGLAGISIEATGLGTEVDFQGLTAYSPADTNGVNQLNYAYDSEEAPATHASLGVFNFAQVGTSDVWFGEWSKTGDNTATSHTVYYSGANADTSVPTSGTATYAVVGINNYDGTAASLLNGTFTADFGAATLTGGMSNSSLTKGVNIGTANINSDASVTGSNAYGAFNGTTVTGGTVSAQFYNGQADLAGLVDFAGTQYDTAFGGSKD
ncbi:MAG: Slam-dependent surface lipoprotein [Marinomonas foliarum]|uniref:Slam-dependent surface lipoprotein n=1 Tax=Marinomonas foliarum TaxID=491950 RepID=UPI003F9C5A80